MMKVSRITLLVLCTLIIPVGLFAQGHWTGSNNTTTPISRTGDVSIGSTSYLHNSSTARTLLNVPAGTTTYGPLLSVAGSSGLDNSEGSSSGSLGYAYTWYAHQGIIGALGSVKAGNIYTNFANKDAHALGGDFSASIDEPIGNPSSAGIYYVGGMRASLSGNITNYADNGIVAAVIGLDQIQGKGTHAGYFDGRGYFSGNVGIGVLYPKNELEVCGTIRAMEVKVETGWCDYVFEDDYKKMSLEAVDAFIAANGHLPKTPSAAELQENGLGLGSATENQQEKIEEIFLHLIEMNDRIKSLESENKTLKEQLAVTKGGK